MTEDGVSAATGGDRQRLPQQPGLPPPPLACSGGAGGWGWGFREMRCPMSPNSSAPIFSGRRDVVRWDPSE
eukprot:3021701-Pyramimonas_sp.AAC.1